MLINGRLMSMVMVTAFIVAVTTKIASSAVYYVSPNGSDGNSGLNEGAAWQHIQKAADAMKAGDTVLVRAGTYRESVTLTHGGDSSAGAVVFQAYPGEKPLLHGADTIPGAWTSCAGDTRFPNPSSTYWIDLPAGWGRGLHEASMFVMDQIFEDGQRLMYAHWPNQANPNDTYFPVQMHPITAATSATMSDTVHLSQADDFWNGAVLKMCFGAGINETHLYQIKDFEKTTGTITVDSAYRRDPPEVANDRYTIMNHPLALDTAGEFYIDYSVTPYRLYLMTREKDNPGNHTIEMSVRGNGFNGYRHLVSWLTLDGFEIKGYYSSAIWLRKDGETSSDLTIRRNHIHQNLGTGIYMGYSTNTLINNVLIEDNVIGNQDLKGIQDASHGTNVCIRRNQLFTNTDDGMQITGIKDLVIEGNTITDHVSVRGHTDALKLEGGDFVNLTIKGNFINAGSTDFGSRGWQTYTNVKIANNIFNATNELFHLAITPVAGCQIINNTFFGAIFGLSIYVNESSSDVVIMNNILDKGIKTTAVTGVTRDYNCFFGATPAEEGAHSITGGSQAMFMDANNHDFRLQAGACAIDQGGDAAGYGVTDDFQAKPRPVDGNSSGTAEYDMGAHEYSANSSFRPIPGKPGFAVNPHPNPFNPSGGKKLIFPNLNHNSAIMIYNINGDLIWKTAAGPVDRIKWDGKNNHGQTVAATCVYMYKIEDKQGNKRSGKITVIR